jgi:hypothetical protein
MARVYLFADEAGNFDFSANGTRYFILTTIVAPDCAAGDALLALRRDMAWHGVSPDEAFHATEDAQSVRNEVFAEIVRHELRIDATILDKSKAMLHLRESEERFYKYAWFYHMKYVAPFIVADRDELLVVGASIGTRKKQGLMTRAIEEVIGQTARSPQVQISAWPAAVDPCLQVADYCCWAIGRKWERGDIRSYALVADKIRSEFDLFKWGQIQYY